MEQNKHYEYLKSFKKEDLIKFYIDKEKQLNDWIDRYHKVKEEISDVEKKCQEKIKDMEARHEKQKYGEWKQHIDTRYLDRYITEFLTEKLKLIAEAHFDPYSEGDYQNLNIKLTLNDKIIASDDTYV